MFSAVGCVHWYLCSRLSSAERVGIPGPAQPLDYGAYFGRQPLHPRVSLSPWACGILSGFHSTQTAIISRTVKSEKQGRMTFYNMMVLEGFIAMVWAAGAMGVYNLGLQAARPPPWPLTPSVWSCRDILGNVGGVIALVGVIVLPITSGDTALRALRPDPVRSLLHLGPVHQRASA